MQQNTNQDAAINKAESIKKHLILKPLVFGIVTLVLIAVGLVFIGMWFKNQPQQDNSPFLYQAQKSESTISVILTPTNFDGENFYVGIKLDTHSVELNQFDLTKILILEFNGNSFKPVTAPGLQGHHSSGELIFRTNEEPKNFKITITDLPEIPIRTFEW